MVNINPAEPQSLPHVSGADILEEPGCVEGCGRNPLHGEPACCPPSRRYQSQSRVVHVNLQGFLKWWWALQGSELGPASRRVACSARIRHNTVKNRSRMPSMECEGMSWSFFLPRGLAGAPWSLLLFQGAGRGPLVPPSSSGGHQANPGVSGGSQGPPSLRYLPS